MMFFPSRTMLNRSFTLIRRSLSPFAAATTLGWSTATTAPLMLSYCEGSSDGDWSVKLQEMADQFAASTGNQLQTAVDSGVPTQVSYGFVCGFCSGMAMKKAGKIAGIVFGMGFMALQSLSYMGYVQVDHVRIKSDVERAFDLNKDGKVDKEDAQMGFDKLMEIAQFNMPGGGGFVAGFMGGLRSG